MIAHPPNFLSLGAGVQSSTLRLMDEEDDPRLRLYFPKSEASIIADTHHEPAAVYAWIEYLKRIKKRAPIYVVSAGDLRAASLKISISKKTGNVYARPLIPAFVAKDNGKKGILGRRCTAEFKVREIIKLIRKMLGKEVFKQWRIKHADAFKAFNDWKKACKVAKKQKLKAPPKPYAAWQEMQADPLAIQWIGISTDEADRMKESREPWIVSRHPLIEMGMSRDDCLAWMKARGYPEPPKSACKWCPFHSEEMWLDQKLNQPAEFAESVAFEVELNNALDQQTGTAALEGRVYFHDSLKPLDQIDFAALVKERQRPGHTQLDLFRNECEGMCGV